MKSNPEIVVDDLARRAGRTLTDADRATLVSMIAATGSFRPGQPVTVSQDGAEIPASDWFAAQAAWLSKLDAVPTGAPALTGNRTERAIAAVAASRSSAARVAAAEQMHLDHGNPFRPGATFNRSRAGFIQNASPALAEKLRQEAAL